jgi:hypothetical protein
MCYWLNIPQEKAVQMAPQVLTTNLKIEGLKDEERDRMVSQVLSKLQPIKYEGISSIMSAGYADIVTVVLKSSPIMKMADLKTIPRTKLRSLEECCILKRLKKEYWQSEANVKQI